MFNRFGLINFEAVPLERFGLEKKWKRLATLQNEAQDLIGRYQEAAQKVAELEQGRQGARDRDLDAHAGALRTGGEVPEPEHEAALDKELDGAVRTRDALQRAVEGAIADVSAYRLEHAAALQRDVAQALEGVAAKLSEHARAAAALYGEYESGTQEARRLVPPRPAEENHSGPQDSTVILGPLTRQTASFAGPNPGEVQRVLSYLASLGAESSSSEATPAA